MTIGLAWVSRRRDGREHLYMASDSRVRGGHRLDACPKILTLPRSDAVICFAGSTAATYPLMLQLANAIAAHQPARDRGLDIVTLKGHLLRLFTDLTRRILDQADPLSTHDVEFLFGGYSWRRKEFRLWNVHLVPNSGTFSARPARSFHPRVPQAAFLGDKARWFRSLLVGELGGPGDHVHLEPLRLLANVLRDTNQDDTIGGPPQVVRVSQHMNTRPLCVLWDGEYTLFGRPLFNYENVDYWAVDPLTGKFSRPRKFGQRVPDDKSNVVKSP